MDGEKGIYHITNTNWQTFELPNNPEYVIKLYEYVCNIYIFFFCYF